VISREDVRLAITGRAAGAGASDAQRRHGDRHRRAPYPAARRAPGGGRQAVPFRREIPEATVWVDVDATDLVETRRALNTADPKRPVSLLALLARFTILGLRRYPELNARIERDEIIVPERVNLGFAAQTDHGPGCPRRARRAPADHQGPFCPSGRAHDGGPRAPPRPADLTGGTFTVNNYGVFGVDGSAAIINHPEVAILGMGRRDRPARGWWPASSPSAGSPSSPWPSTTARATAARPAASSATSADCIESPTTALGDM